MRLNAKLVLTLLAALPSTFAAVNGKCSNGKNGICIATGTCSNYGGTYSSGYCPNDPSNIKCCENIKCKYNGTTGSCKFTDQCNGTPISGLCPGGTNFKCCIPKKTTTKKTTTKKTTTKKTTTVKPSTTKCTYMGIAGSCIDVNKTKCKNNQTVVGYCPGASNIKCCLPTLPSICKKALSAAEYARAHAHASSTGWCAAYVANALENSGFSFVRQASAYMYHTNGILRGMGFKEISKQTPQKGDVAVEENTSSHVHGHIQIHDGKNWISDFIQNSENVHSSNPGKIHYYRCTN